MVAPAGVGHGLKLLLTADSVGGVFSYVVSLARGLSSRGAELAVATMGPPPTDAQRLELTRIPGVTLFESQFALEWMDTPWEDVDRAGEWLLELERELRPDVIHLNGYCHAALPWSAPVVAVAHSCVLSWWRAVLQEEAPARYGEYRSRVKAGLDRAARVIAPSHAMLLSVREHYAPKAQLAVIPNGADPQVHRSGPVPKEPLFFAAGRFWDRAKNLGLLERVASKLPWPVYVAGDCAPGAAETPTPSSLRFLGALPPLEMPRWLSRASVFVHPARYEPFGLSVLEAAQSGCALILGSIPSLRELWEDAAVYVDPDDPAELVAACQRLARDRDARELMAERAREHAERYGLDVMTESYWNTYRELVSPASMWAGARERKRPAPGFLNLAAGGR
jgi:glycosyltransferase involved in cell wall biosynthesis